MNKTRKKHPADQIHVHAKKKNGCESDQES